MKRALLLLTLCLGPFLAPASHGVTDAEVQAETLVTRYFDALFTGDTQTLGKLLGRELLSTRQNLLNNPDYPSHLLRRYSGARFEIIDSYATGDGGLVVDAIIDLPSASPLSLRFLLRREKQDFDDEPTLYIVSETEPSYPL
jgi:hypothetical protein